MYLQHEVDQVVLVTLYRNTAHFSTFMQSSYTSTVTEESNLLLTSPPTEFNCSLEYNKIGNYSVKLSYSREKFTMEV